MATDPVQRLAALFAGNASHYGTHGEPSRDPTGQSLKWVIKPTAKTLKGPTTEAMWQAHVDGKKPLGVVPIRTDDTVVWGCIDYDVYGEDLTELIAKVESMKLPLVPCRSKSGGLHLFCFTVEPVPAKQMRQALNAMAASLGIAGSEVFPKQDTLDAGRDDKGSWMIMPYYGDTYDGKLERQVGLRKNGSEIGLPEFVRIAERARLSPAQLDAAVQASPAPPARGSRRRGSATGKKDNTSVPFGDGPPCLQRMVEQGGVRQGGQNNALFHMGVYFKKKHPETWEDELVRASQLYCDPPYPEASVDTVIKSLRKKEYLYKCKDEPMRANCDSILCRKRTFGVPDEGLGDSDNMPKITRIRKIVSPGEDPHWYVTIEGSDREMEITEVKNLAVYKYFAHQCISQLDRSFKPVKQSQEKWEFALEIALSSRLTVEQAPADMTPRGQFMLLLEKHLTDRRRGQSRDDLLRDVPWENEDKERYEFTMLGLNELLKREKMKVSMRDIGKWIRELGGDKDDTSIRGKSVHLWWIPSSAVQKMPQLATPPMKLSVV